MSIDTRGTSMFDNKRPLNHNENFWIQIPSKKYFEEHWKSFGDQKNDLFTRINEENLELYKSLNLLISDINLHNFLTEIGMKTNELFLNNSDFLTKFCFFENQMMIPNCSELISTYKDNSKFSENIGFFGLSSLYSLYLNGINDEKKDVNLEWNSGNKLDNLMNKSINCNKIKETGSINDFSSLIFLDQNVLRNKQNKMKTFKKNDFLPFLNYGSLRLTNVLNIENMKSLYNIDNIPSTIEIPKYFPGIKMILGEAGRELLRACIRNKKGKEYEVHNTSIVDLLKLAYESGLWMVAVKIHLEHRGIIPMSEIHYHWRKHKSIQNKKRRNILEKESNLFFNSSGHSLNNLSIINKFENQESRIGFQEIDTASLTYYPGIVLKLGHEGRKSLIKAIRLRHEEAPEYVNAILKKNGLSYGQIRNATVSLLLTMAYLCGLWEVAVGLHNQHMKRRKVTKPKIKYTGEDHEENQTNKTNRLDFIHMEERANSINNLCT